MDPDYDYLLGGFFIGVLVSTLLLGCLVVQAYRYWSQVPADEPRYIKYMVAILCALGLGHSVMIAHATYTIFVKHFGDLTVITPVPVTSPASSVPMTLEGVIIQGFFSFRLYRLSRNKWIYAVNWTLAVTRFVFGIVAYAISAVINRGNLDLYQRTQWMFVAAIVCSVGQDAIIAIGMTWYLSKRKTTASERMNNVVHRIILVVLEGGVLTSVIGITYGIVESVLVKSSIWYIFYFTWPKTYLISFFLALNARKAMRDHLSDAEMTVVSLRFAGEEQSTIHTSTPSTLKNTERC